MSTHRLLHFGEPASVTRLQRFLAVVILSDGVESVRYEFHVSAENVQHAEDLALQEAQAHLHVTYLSVRPVDAPNEQYARVDTRPCTEPLTVTRWQRIKRRLAAVRVWLNQPMKGIL